MSQALEPYRPGPFDLTHKLTVEKHGHTALITINHPPANTWDRESLIGLRQLIEHLDRDDDIRALVLTGQGAQFFSAGADSALLGDRTSADAHTMATLMSAAFEALRRFRGLSVAALNGHARGAGLECALACDLRIAESHVQLAMDQAVAGLMPCAGGTQWLTWLLGEPWAKRLLLCGEVVDAGQALRIGLVEHVAEIGEARGHALLLAARSCRQSPRAVRELKSLIQGARERSPESWLAEEQRRFVGLFDAHDTREGLDAYFERREPRWTGR